MQPPAPAKNEQRNIAERARRFAHVEPGDRTAYWHKYNKGSEGEEFWKLYKQELA
jgi:hypothetical protein